MDFPRTVHCFLPDLYYILGAMLVGLQAFHFVRIFKHRVESQAEAGKLAGIEAGSYLRTQYVLLTKTSR